ncbi:DUF397 domain-containing protein [Solidesulfovibrio carbinolicus]|uniref:DUF397 domain-containing protein n=1 Tax=Solidesulfovibrio carbinolicus TaxID=296842 RepID=A0A4P6HG75_9BACT|nr:DUF397 domain-containing protein [Solidesulfovibrio carbinolicus]QAZ66053.1 DUF397 domain-containing protein [Solidesulfovibrio carbinolicus]
MQKTLKSHGKTFKISSFSGSGHNCVGVSINNDMISVINTNTKDSIIDFTKDEWSAFIAGVKNSEFDL